MIQKESLWDPLIDHVTTAISGFVACARYVNFICFETVTIKFYASETNVYPQPFVKHFRVDKLTHMGQTMGLMIPG